MSAPMVRALLTGAKTQTRRLVDMRHIGFIGGRDDDHDDPSLWGFGDEIGCWHVLDQSARPWFGDGVQHESYALAPPWQVGDRLWVRETMRVNEHGEWCYAEGGAVVIPPHSTEQLATLWGPAQRNVRPGIHMPRWASRITLEVTEVRVQRLQDISEEDARAEGVARDTEPCDHKRQYCEDVGCLGPTYRSTFCELWDEINGKPRRRWSDNPWIWAISFRRVTP